MLVYCDSMILIYYMDHIGPFQDRAANRLASLRANGDRLVVSDLTRLECRVTPIRLGDALALAKFDAFFALPDVRYAPLTTAAFDRATQLRATRQLKTLDALRLAAAIEAGCEVFLTNDARLGSIPGIAVEILP
jgi:uncharacterized protein